MSYIVKCVDGVSICDTWQEVIALDAQILEVSIDTRSSDEIEVKTNLMSGLEFVQAVDTPLCCDASSETYWSM